MSKPRIMLDAGHYGYQNRSPIYPSYYEAKQMWKLHLYLKEELETYGFEVGTTRTTQTENLSLKERGLLAEGYDLFISLHSDAAEVESVNRCTTFYAHDDWNKASVLAQKMSNTIGECMGVPGKIKTRLSTNGAWDYYSVMFYARQAGCPLYYIVEHSFHTNRASAKWLMDESNLRKLAKAEAATIAEYYGLKKENIEPENKGVSTVNIELSILKNGSRGEEVKTLQALLNAKGYKGKNGRALTVDGIFGANCDYAVKEFQKANQLTSDAIVGAKTWNKLLKG